MKGFEKMTSMQIKCTNCNKTWIIYPRGAWTDDINSECPNCGCSIDRQTWERQITPAFGAFMDTNKELYKDATGYNAPLFKVNFIEE